MKSHKNITVSIGIPAYNEEANIKHLLISLLSQREKGFQLLEIIVISDGSTDRTVSTIRGVKDNRVKLIVKSKRKGQAERQNGIARLFKGDILVLLEADTLPANKNFIWNLVSPFKYKNGSKIGITYGRALALPSRNFFEKVMCFKDGLKEKIYQNIVNKNSLHYGSGNKGRAFSKRFAKKIRWPSDVPEDFYSFLVCTQLGFEVVYIPNALIYYKLVGNFREYCRQYSKFIKGKKALSKYFAKEKLALHYKLPFLHALKEFIRAFIKNPLLMTVYLFALAGVKLTTFKVTDFSPYLIEVYPSSKTLVLPGENKFLLEDKESRRALDHFDKFASNYDRFAFKRSMGLRYLSKLETSFIDEHVQNDTLALSYLDMGVGTGRNTEVLLNKGINVTGVDFSENMLKETKRRYKLFMESGRLRLQRVDLNKDLPFHKDKFDGALCIRVIKYVTNWRDLISEAARVIKQDGVFILEISNRYSVAGISQFLRNYFTFQPEEVEEALSNEGFKILDKRVGSKLPFELYSNVNSERVIKFIKKIELVLRKLLGELFSRNVIYYCKKI